MNIRRLIVVASFSILLSGCSNSGGISPSELSALEKRVEVLESQVALLGSQAGNQEDESQAEEVSDFKTTTVESGVPDSNEFDEFVVDLTMENVNDYLSLEYVPADYITNSDGVHYNSILITSNVFDKGWVYRDSSEFHMEIDNPYDENDQSVNAFEEFSSLFTDEQTEQEPRIVSVRGKLKFESINVIKKYEVDDFNYKRSVVFHDGKGSNKSLNSATYTHKY